MGRREGVEEYGDMVGVSGMRLNNCVMGEFGV